MAESKFFFTGQVDACQLATDLDPCHGGWTEVEQMLIDRVIKFEGFIFYMVVIIGH